jgi:fructose-1,6-bisphosphatase/inositol monophosphatase family enzyme/transcriptional regulator with XRE-family HTH domain
MSGTESTWSLGNTIAQLRNKAKLTQDELAARVRVHGRSVQRWEGDENQPLGPTLRRLAAVLGVPFSAFEPPGDRGLLGELDSEQLQDLERMATAAAFAGGNAVMPYFEAALAEGNPLGLDPNPSHDADIDASAGVLRTLIPETDRISNSLGSGLRYSLFGEELSDQAKPAVQERIREVLARLGVTELAPEVARSGTAFGEGLAGRLSVLFDALDGTTNLTCSIPLFCCAVAVFDGVRPFLGAIYDPSRHSMYYGSIPTAASGTAWEWHVSTGGTVTLKKQEDDPRPRVLATHLSRSDEEARTAFWPQLNRLMSAPGDDGGTLFKNTMMLGSGQLAMAWVAAGRVAAFVNRSTGLHDTAAGEAIVRAAGGRVTTFDGDDIDYASGAARTSVVATLDDEVHDRLIRLLEQE